MEWAGILRINFWIMTTVLCALICVQTVAQTMPTQTAPPHTNPQQSRTARIVEDVPGPQEYVTKALVRVRAEHTPSGYPVPRYVSLKYGNAIGRTGPSSQHPIAWRYKRRGLPMIVVAETEVWRKVRDVNGDESWMNRRLLDGKHMVLARTEIILRTKPRSDSSARAIAAKGALLILETCDANNWCKVQSSTDHMSGYALRSLLWGAEPL